MRIQRLIGYETRIPLRMTFRHALASRNEAHNVIVRAESDDGVVGWGECVPRDYVTGETPDSAVTTLSRDLSSHFLSRRFESFEAIVDSISRLLDDLPRERHAAFCSLELSLLDLAGRTFHRSAADLLGSEVTDPVRYSGVVSSEEPDAARRVLEALRAFGFTEVKIKVGLDETRDRMLLIAARDVLGDSCGLRVDANGAWDAEEALRRLADFEPFRLEGVEQPLRWDDWDGLAWLTARSPTPVVVDESLVSRDDARRLVNQSACHCFNLRVSKCGGLINSAWMRDLAARAGLECQVGAQVGETALLSAAGRHLASRTPNLRWCEGSYGRLLLEDDIGTDDLTVSRGGYAPAIDGVGLGVEVDTDRLERLATRRFELGSA